MITPERRAYLESANTDNPLPYVPPGPFPSVGALKQKIASVLPWMKKGKSAGAAKVFEPIQPAAPSPAPTPAAITPPPAPAPSASITKPSTTPAPMTTPSTSKAPTAAAPKVAPLTDSKFMARIRFESLSHEERNKFIRNGGHLVDMSVHESEKGAAERNIQHVNDTPENVAEVLIKGWGLSTADATEMVLAKYNGQYDSKARVFHTEASLKEAIAKAERSPRPTGYLLQGAHAVDQPKKHAALNTFKKPSEVSEPDRLAAETALMNLYAEFEKIEDSMVRRVWWERNRETVHSHAVNETRRNSEWLGVFIARLPHYNAHTF
jgi:hypothetical protein